MAQTKVKTKGITDTNVTNAKLGTDISAAKLTAGTVATARLGSGTASSSTYLAGDQTYKALSEYDDNQLQSNVAMLGFKVAVNGSLTRYNLVDQSIDEFYDTSGIDASASTNEARVASGSNFYYDGATTVTPTVTEDADSVTTDGDYTVYKWTDTGSTGSYNTNTTQDHEYLIVAGGGSGGYGNGGGGGAGGYLTATGLSLTGGNAYTITVGAGGAPRTGGDGVGNVGNNSILSGTGISTLTSGGGGYGSNGSNAAGAGGSGGGSGYQGGAAGTATGVGIGNAGSTQSTGAPQYGAGGGGGAGAAGTAGTNAGGGGGCSNSDDSTCGDGGNGGGGDGVTNGTQSDSDATPNTGGGGGGIQSETASGTGGSGVVILRRITSTTTTGADLTLQSTDVTAVAEPDFGEFVTLIENAYGTATLNTDIKGYISRDSGTTFTQGTLVDEGTWGTNKKVLGFHDLDISSQPSGTSMCYKITTHNQSASSKETRVYATSIGWR